MYLTSDIKKKNVFLLTKQHYIALSNGNTWNPSILEKK